MLGFARRPVRYGQDRRAARPAHARGTAANFLAWLATDTAKTGFPRTLLWLGEGERLTVACPAAAPEHRIVGCWNRNGNVPILRLIPSALSFEMPRSQSLQTAKPLLVIITHRHCEKVESYANPSNTLPLPRLGNCIEEDLKTTSLGCIRRMPDLQAEAPHATMLWASVRSHGL